MKLQMAAVFIEKIPGNSCRRITPDKVQEHLQEE
jgi:hypothetical protein